MHRFEAGNYSTMHNTEVGVVVFVHDIIDDPKVEFEITNSRGQFVNNDIAASMLSHEDYTDIETAALLSAAESYFDDLDGAEADYFEDQRKDYEV